MKKNNVKALLLVFSVLISAFFSCSISQVTDEKTDVLKISGTKRTLNSKAVDVIFTEETNMSRAVVTDSSDVDFFSLNMVADSNEYDVSNLKFGKDESYSFVAKKNFSATVSVDAYNNNNVLIAHGSVRKDFKVDHDPSETNVIIQLDQIFNNTTSDYKIIPTMHDLSKVKFDDTLDYYRFNSDKTLITFDSEKGPYYQIDLKNLAILSCTSSNAEIKYLNITDENVVIDLYSDELPEIYEYTFDLSNKDNESSVGEYNYTYNATDYEGNEMPTECTHEILSGENYVTISSNGVIVAQVILPIENFSECEVLWTSVTGLTCEGQILYSNKYAIATYVNGIWKQNKHENWETPDTDSSGNNLSGSGEGGACDYNFRYSIETSLESTEELYGSSDDGGEYQDGGYLKSTSIIRSDDLSTSDCILYDNYFSFDFNNGAMFQISYEGNVLYTSECSKVSEYSETYGVCIMNFSKTDTKIEFDLLDGEYSTTDFAHYVISL